MDDAVYVLDANVFITAERQYYAFDLLPRFWEVLQELAERGVACSVDRVQDELERGKGELAEWAKTSAFNEAFVSTDDTDVISAYQDIMNWVNEQDQFKDEAKAEFADCADGWLVAYAKVTESVIVTHEQLNPQIKRRVPIPNVCEAYGVRYVDTFTMLRELDVRLG